MKIKKLVKKTKDFKVPISNGYVFDLKYSIKSIKTELHHPDNKNFIKYIKYLADK